MAILTVTSQSQKLPILTVGGLMIHNDEPPLVVVVTEVMPSGDFMGTSLEDGVHIEWAAEEFKPFIGKLTLEQ